MTKACERNVNAVDDFRRLNIGEQDAQLERLPRAVRLFIGVVALRSDCVFDKAVGERILAKEAFRLVQQQRVAKK